MCGGVACWPCHLSWEVAARWPDTPGWGHAGLLVLGMRGGAAVTSFGTRLAAWPCSLALGPGTWASWVALGRSIVPWGRLLRGEDVRCSTPCTGKAQDRGVRVLVSFARWGRDATFPCRRSRCDLLWQKSSNQAGCKPKSLASCVRGARVQVLEVLRRSYVAHAAY